MPRHCRVLRCFYPRHPRGWRLGLLDRSRRHIRVSIHATLAGGDRRLVVYVSNGVYVSIHATLAGGDIWASTRLPPTQVSIHATLAGGDQHTGQRPGTDSEFLSTPPSRVATGQTLYSRSSAKFLSTPPSRVATVQWFLPAGAACVSIHATLAGGDDSRLNG